jgi:hypothetical protein
MDRNLKSKNVTNNNINANTKDDKKDNKKDTPIPNALTITINTSVPGYQTIKYKPDMTIKNIDKDEKTVWFDPLVPLEQSVINKVPESIRVLEFFNKGLFESLINAHGMKKPITLEQAKRNKIVDNNIQVTLNNLFPTNGILYIKGEPYAIADVQWTKSDWKIDRKITETPQVDVNKILDPIAYNAMIKNEINEGNKQLLMLPKDLIYGVNFNKETEQLSSVDKEKELIDKAKAEEAARIKVAVEAKAKELEEAKNKAAVEAKAKELEAARLKALEETRLREAEAAKLKKLPMLAIENQKTQTPPPKPPKPLLKIEDQIPPIPPTPSKPVLQIENQIPPTPPTTSKPVLQIENIQNIQMSEEFLPKLLTSQESTKIVRKYFGDNEYYSMISMIYKNMPNNYKKNVIDIYRNTTNIDVKESGINISKAAYDFTLTGIKQISSSGVLVKKQYTDGLKIISNSGGGNCLFIAVADAINYYNYNNDIDKKILYNIYGNGDNLFTTAVLRNIVSTEIIKLFNSNRNFHKSSLEEGQINVDNLNDIFERAITTPESIELQNQEEGYYNSTLLDIYTSNDNFFVIIPENIQNRNRPFKLVENNNEIKSYIESVYYWADQKTIDIFKKILKLSIIVIKNEDGKFTLPYPNIHYITTLFDEPNIFWDKYLFLYNVNNHYELMTFDYLKKSSKTLKYTRKKEIIFDMNNNDVFSIPPFYIIFFIFGAFYLKTLPNEKDIHALLFSIYFYVLYDSFKHIIKTQPRTENIEKFITDIKKYFGPVNELLQLGGAINNNYNYNKYGNNYRGSPNFLKKEEKQDNIKISFHITIDMELQKGTTLSKDQISNIKCIKGWNKVRKSFAEFTGKKYVIPPVYENLSDKFVKNDKNEDLNKKEEINDNNNTKKITGGNKRRRRTIKKYITK